MKSATFNEWQSVRLATEAFEALTELQEMFLEEQQVKLTKAQIISAALLKMLAVSKKE